MTGSIPFLIEDSDQFRRSFKKLVKVHGTGFVNLIAGISEDLIEDQYPNNSRQEPLPSKIQLPDEWTFHKLELRVSKGASGQVRLMYLVNSATCTIRLVWIYSHEQFTKRPADGDLKAIIREILEG